MEKEISKDNLGGRICGLLLAGGFSTRMGTDKAFISFGSQPMYQHLIQILASVCTDVKISCRQEQQSLFKSDETIVDAMPSSGPLTGLISAFMTDRQSSWLIIPVDMPYLTADFLKQYLINQRDLSADATIILDTRTATLQPLLGIYEASSYPIIWQRFQEGQYSVKKILTMLKVTAVPFTGDQKILANFNSPNDWQGW